MMLIFMGYDEYHIQKVLKFRYPNGSPLTPAQIYNLALRGDRLATRFKFSEIEIIEALEIYELMELEFKKRKENKMTREEALQKLYPFQWGTDKRKEFLDGLEALGLIKFEEDKLPYDTRSLTFSSQTPCAYQAIAQLESLGYKVAKR